MKKNLITLFIGLLFILWANAELNFHKTSTSIFIFQNAANKSLLVIPTNASDFVEINEAIFEFEEKLGSYKYETFILQKAKNIQLVEIKKNEAVISLQYSFTLGRNQESIQFILKEIDNKIEFLIQEISNPKLTQITFHFVDVSEAIFGAGIQFSHCNVKGQHFPLLVEENGVGRGDKGSTFLANLLGAAGNEHTTYAPIPFFINSNQIAYTLQSNQHSFWDVDFTQNNKVIYTLNALQDNKLKNASIAIQTGDALSLVAENNTAQRTAMPEWMFHYILGVQGGKNRVDSLLQELQKNNIKPGAIWIQDWVGKRLTPIGSRLQWDWKANESVYPNIQAWIDSLQQQNIKVLAYINPYFVEGGEQAQEGMINQYFVKDDKGTSYKFAAGGFNAYMLDLSNPSAVTWAKNIIQTEILGLGFDGWMCDFGEWLPIYPNIYDEQILDHNSFPVAWSKLNWEAAQELHKENEVFIFNRSAYQGSQSLPINMWLGDQLANFGKNDGLASAVNAYNSASLSGIPLIHSDIGGYTAIKLGPISFLRNDEVLKRWIEMEAFTPFWRSHEGLMPQHMSQIYQDADMMQYFAYYDSIHKSLIPYFQSLEIDLIAQQHPYVLHPFLLYPKDSNTYTIQYQFFVGKDLLVCPVVEEGAESVTAYLPKGKWQHFFTKEIFEGEKTYTFAAPIGQAAVFWRLPH